MKIQSKIILELSGEEFKALETLLGEQTTSMYRSAGIGQEGEDHLAQMYHTIYMQRGTNEL